jgi:hypothetical protein
MGMEHNHPFPCPPHLFENVSRRPPTARQLRGLPPPSQGGQVSGDSQGKAVPGMFIKPGRYRFDALDEE